MKSKAVIEVTIQDGQMKVDSQGFVGMECADDALNRELRALGNLQGAVKRKPDTRPVEDVNVVNVKH